MSHGSGTLRGDGGYQAVSVGGVRGGEGGERQDTEVSKKRERKLWGEGVVVTYSGLSYFPARFRK